MAFIDKMSIREFKGHVQEEARRLNTCGLTEVLSFEGDPNTIQANIAKHIFPQRNQNNKHPMCTYYRCHGHTEQEHYKQITEEYNAMQAQKAQNPKRGHSSGRGRGGHRSGRGGEHGGNSGNTANLANANTNRTASSYNSIFGGIVFCLTAAINGRIKKVRGV
jgi:hypothetical protein